MEYKQELKKLKKFLERERKDCLKLKRKDDLTKEGVGMLIMIDSIYDYMEWK